MKKTLFSFTSLALGVLLLPSQLMAQPTTAFKGQQLFGTYCFVCHGTEGRGDGPLAKKMEKPPADLTNKSKMSRYSSKELFQIVKGTSTHDINGAMPQWGKALSDPDITALAAYVRFLSTSEEALPGDPARGQVIYAQSCSACHGANGKGDGVMANILPMKPADHTRTGGIASMSNYALMDIIANGKNGYMPPWKGLLSNDDMADVVSYIRLLSH